MLWWGMCTTVKVHKSDGSEGCRALATLSRKHWHLADTAGWPRTRPRRWATVGLLGFCDE